MGTGVGPDALRLMARRWVIDAAWSWDHGTDGFVWIARRLPQRFAVEKVGDRSRLIVTTTVVDGIEDGARAREALRGFNLVSKGSMWLHSAERGAIELHCGIELDPARLEAQTHDLSTFALLQLFTAEILAAPLAESAGGRPAYRPHPTSGVRDEPDEILTMVDQALVPIGMSPSQFADPDEMATALAEFEGSPFAVETLVDGVVIRGSTTLDGAGVEVRIDPLAGDPDLGAGLLATVRLSAGAGAGAGATPGAGAPDPDRWAWHLNVAERAGAFAGPLNGAWEPYDDDSGTGVVHTAFTPNALSRGGSAREAAATTVRRAVWAAGRTAAGRTAS